MRQLRKRYTDLCPRGRWRIAALSGMLWFGGCQSADRHDALLPADARACRPGVYLLELPREGGFILNHDPRDSTRISTWIQDALAKRDTALRIVFVRVDSNRQAELRWLVPAIRSVDARPYAEDGSCKPVVRAPL